ncbi:hypothetical protein V2J09_014948 [Rumex salicifolius]
MACSLQSGTVFFETSAKLDDWNRQLELGSVKFPTQFLGNPVVTLKRKPMSSPYPRPNSLRISAQASYCVSTAMRWWEKTLMPNMIEIQSAQELVDTLKNAGDRLVIVDFYSPACGACKALHPKMCQLAETNPGAIFLKVNHEELKNMCHALHIHVLPFFRFYKGSQGQVRSFSCTISTIKKFKDAMAKHSSEQQSDLVFGPAKGLSESELLNLASVGEISLNGRQETQLPLSVGKKKEMENLFIEAIQNPSPMSILGAKEDNFILGRNG